MEDLIFAPPGAFAPGYLKRIRQALAFQDALDSDELTAKVVDELVDFLVDFVEEPKDRGKAKALLWDVSKQQFNDMLEAIGGGSDDTPPLA